MVREIGKEVGDERIEGGNVLVAKTFSAQCSSQNHYVLVIHTNRFLFYFKFPFGLYKTLHRMRS